MSQAGIANLQGMIGNMDLHVAKLIVNSTANAGGNYTTITAALAAAVSGDTIFVMPGATGTYTENLTLKAGVNIVAFDADAQNPNVTIIGKMTATFAGSCSISGIRLQTNADYVLEITGASATVINLINCYINATNANAIHSTTSSGSSVVKLLNCRGNCATNTYFIFTGGNLQCYYSFLEGLNSTTASTFANAPLEFYWSVIPVPVSTSGTTSFGSEWTYFKITNATALTIAGTTGNDLINLSRIESGTGVALTVSAGATVQMTNSSVFSTNANTITGAGIIKYGHIDFYGTSHTKVITTTTQTPLDFIASAFPVVMPAGDYTLLNSDYFVGATTSAARAITLPASPGTGESHRIKDITGTAGANNITVSGNGKNIDGAATFVINTNRGSIDVIYNGTEWSIV